MQNAILKFVWRNNLLMNKEKRKIGLKAFLDYISGKRKGKEAFRIEREAMQDPFLAEALDGYDSVSGDHASGIASLRERIEKRTRKKTSFTGYYRIAAVVLLCLISGGVFWILQREDSLELYSQLPPQSESLREEEPAPFSSESEEIAAISDKRNVFSEKQQTSVNKKTTEQWAPPAEPATKDINRAEEKEIFADNSEKSSEDYLAQQQELPIVAESMDEVSESVAVFDLEKEEQKLMVLTDKKDTVGVKSREPASITSGYAMAKRSTAAGQVLSSGASPDLSMLVVKAHPTIGPEAYNKYLTDQKIVPQDSSCIRVHGTVQLRFRVDKKGRPADIEVVKSLCLSLDNEAIRLLKNGSDWTPEGMMGELEVKFD